MKTRLNRAVALMALLLSTSASASVVWRGDFETGDLSQWSSKQAVAADRLQVVTSPVTQGRQALRVTVRQGDDPIDASGNRNELVYLSYEPAGTERWYRWQTMWPLDYPSASKWQLFTQWHHSGTTGSPPVEFAVVGEQMGFNVQGRTAWSTGLVRGSWHDFILHVKWSPDASQGFVEFYYDGQLVLPRTAMATQFSGQSQYLKQGLYRDESIAPEAVIFHDGMVIGTSFEDVAGELTGPDAGTVDPEPDAGGVDPGTDSGSVEPEPDSGSVDPGTDAGGAVQEPDSGGVEPDASQQQPDATDGLDEAAQVGCSSAGGRASGGAGLFAMLLGMGAVAARVSRRR